MAPRKNAEKRKAIFGMPGQSRTKGLAALQANQRVSPVHVPRPGRRHKPAIDPKLQWKHISRHVPQSRKSRTQRPHARQGRGRGSHGPTQRRMSQPREWKKRSESWKKCLANPLRENRICTKLEIATTKKTRTRPSSRGGHHGPHRTRTHQDVMNRWSTESNTPEQKAASTHDPSHGRRPLETRAMQSLPFLVGAKVQGTRSPRPGRCSFDQEPHRMKITKSNVTHKAWVL